MPRVPPGSRPSGDGRDSDDKGKERGSWQKI